MKGRLKMSVKKLVYTSLFASLTAIGGFISFPLPISIVPVTLQVIFFASAGFILGPGYGALSQLIYLFIGAVGLPVFSNQSGGFGMLYGPTSGFLWGFVAGAFVIGLISQRVKPKDIRLIYAVLLAGLIVLYICGMLGLMLTVKYSIGQAFATGVAPFIPIDLFKLLVAAFAIKKAVNLQIDLPL